MRRIKSLLLGSLAIITIPLGSLAQTSSAEAATNPSSEVTAYAKQYGGEQISANQIAWQAGKVVMTFPTSGASRALAPGEKVAQGTANCPSGWSCLYAASNFDGRRLQFFDCGFQSLSNYGFRDMATSWHNAQSAFTTVVYDVINNQRIALWFESPGARSSNVGAANNDRADVIEAC
jgi:hypothetical protein